MKPTTPIAGPFTPGNVQWQVTHRGELEYLVYLPPDYATSDKKWPLMLFLHGSGERGTNVNLVTVHGPLKLAKAGTNFPFIIVAPQCPPGEHWQNDALLQLLDKVTHQYRVDEKRVYLTGLSMGGFGTWSLGISHPERFAAIMPICGGGETLDIGLALRTRKDALRQLPVWAFHGAKDPTVPLEETERMIKSLKTLGSEQVKLTVYPEAQHDCWTETYNNPEVYTWLLSHSRP